MKEYEKEIISTIKSLVINGVKNLDGYNEEIDFGNIVWRL